MVFFEALLSSSAACSCTVLNRAGQGGKPGIRAHTKDITSSYLPTIIEPHLPASRDESLVKNSNDTFTLKIYVSNISANNFDKSGICRGERGGATLTEGPVQAGVNSLQGGNVGAV